MSVKQSAGARRVLRGGPQGGQRSATEQQPLFVRYFLRQSVTGAGVVHVPEVLSVVKVGQGQRTAFLSAGSQSAE